MEKDMEKKIADGKKKDEVMVYDREEYAKQQFWEDRFKDRPKSSNFDWYIEWEQAKRHFEENKIPKEAKILNVGCGDSKMSFQMFKDGYENITNIDISPSAIEMMKFQQEKKKTSMKWLVMDALNMDFEDGEFDVVIDKGTLDALCCGSNYELPGRLLVEMKRVCKAGGKIFMVSNSDEKNRRHIFEKYVGDGGLLVRYYKQFLSDSVNLINIMRSVGNGKSIKQVMFDEELMKKVVLKYKFSSFLRGRRQRIQKWVTMEYGEAKEDEVKQELQEEKESQEKEAQKTIGNVEKKEDVPESKETQSQDDDKKDATEDKKPSYNAPRQDHCFIYLMDKVK